MNSGNSAGLEHDRELVLVGTVVRLLFTPLAGGRDIALLVGRVLLGVVLMAHGYEKFFQWGLGGTSARFTQLRVPMPGPSARYAASVELLGGGLLIVGAATTLVSALVVLDMIGAAIFSRAVFNGIRLLPGQQGWELNGTILAMAAALLVFGAGRYGIDHLVRHGVAARTAGR